MMRFLKSLIGICFVAVVLLTARGSAETIRKTESTAPLFPFSISLSPHSGEITQTYYPAQRIPDPQPDFILIQNVHCNIYVQFAISSILGQLKTQGILPQRIAVEGAVGPVDLRDMQSNPDARERREIANHMVAEGEMPGATHFAAAEGEGALYGVEPADLYQSAVDIFRRSYYARANLSKDLDRLEAAVALLKTEPAESARASIIDQDIQVIRRLVDQQLVPTEIHQVMNQAVFAVAHLKNLMSDKKENSILEPVSAAVDFYALALLRDKGLYKHAQELRQRDHQKTTVLIAGGFHTAGLTRQLKEEGYSYAVITPRVGTYHVADERLYFQRLLGSPLVPGPVEASVPVAAYGMNTAETWHLANKLRDKLPNLALIMPAVRDIFTAMDNPLQPSIKLSLVKQRAEMLSSAEQMALNH